MYAGSSTTTIYRTQTLAVTLILSLNPTLHYKAGPTHSSRTFGNPPCEFVLVFESRKNDLGKFTKVDFPPAKRSMWIEETLEGQRKLRI